MQENEFLEILKKQVGQKFHLPESELWKQRDFEYLSDLIFGKTKIRLSISTLKRIWKNYNNRSPQPYTLNTLANLLDYESWSNFKQSITNELIENHRLTNNKEEKPPNRFRSIYLLLVPLLLFIAYLAIRYIDSNELSYHQDDIVFKSRKTTTVGVPNTVVFEYDISKLDFDSAYIQQSWDERMRARVNKDNHFQTFIYYYPGYHTAKLILNNKVVKQEKININTAGWEAMVDDNTEDEAPVYIKQTDIINNNSLHVSPQRLLDYGVSIKGKKILINYFNIGEFKRIHGEDFTLETRLKNGLDEGARQCQFSQVTIICENGMISIPFSNPGCVSNIHLHISEVFKDGKKNDLSAFGIDLSKWRDIKIETKKKKVEIFVDHKSTYHLSFNKNLGRVTGFNYRFEGLGAIDMLKLYNAKHELSYYEDFDK